MTFKDWKCNWDEIILNIIQVSLVQQLEKEKQNSETHAKNTSRVI